MGPTWFKDAAEHRDFIYDGADPELPNAKDASDWINAGGTKPQLEALLADCAPLTLTSLNEWRAHFVPPESIQDCVSWPEPIAIHSELPPVEKFTDDLLPVSFRPLVLDVAERMQVPIDYPAVVATTA